MKKVFTTALVVAVVALFSSCGNMEKDVKKYFEKKKECTDLQNKYNKSKSGEDEQAYNKCDAQLDLLKAKMDKKYSGARDSVKYKEYDKFYHVQDSIFRAAQNNDNNGNEGSRERGGFTESNSSMDRSFSSGSNWGESDMPSSMDFGDED